MAARCLHRPRAELQFVLRAIREMRACALFPSTTQGHAVTVPVRMRTLSAPWASWVPLATDRARTAPDRDSSRSLRACGFLRARGRGVRGVGRPSRGAGQKPTPLCRPPARRLSFLYIGGPEPSEVRPACSSEIPEPGMLPRAVQMRTQRDPAASSSSRRWRLRDPSDPHHPPAHRGVGRPRYWRAPALARVVAAQPPAVLRWGMSRTLLNLS